jgi:cbb3-type cytochrome oxidase maturation protein
VTNLVLLIPVALFLGGLGLAAFVWALRSGQYEDLDGAAERILLDDTTDPIAHGASGSCYRRQ